MANPEHVELVKRGWEAIKEWREVNPDVRLDLRRFQDALHARMQSQDVSFEILGASISLSRKAGVNALKEYAR